MVKSTVRGAWCITVATYDPRVLSAVKRSAEEISIPYEVVTPSALPRSSGPETVYCFCSRAAFVVPELPGPAIIVCTGMHVRDEALIRLVRSWVVPIRLPDLTGHLLLRCLLELSSRSRLGDAVLRFTMAERLLARIPQPLIDAFLLRPRIKALHDIASAVALNGAQARRLVRQAGFTDPRHLVTTLRASVWKALVGLGVNRRVTELHLGITDRSTFVRCCRRAGVPVPWTSRSNREPHLRSGS